MIIKNRTNSSWWLGNDFFSEDRDILTGDIVSDRTSELIKLSGYRRAISNFVNIVTGKSDIPVRFAGRDSYTDGKSVTISASIKDKDFDSTVGLALHEGSHVLLTDFKILPNLELEISSWADATDVYSTINEKYEMKSHMAAKSYVKDKIRNLLNIVEDRRIDNFVFKSAPGYKGYYHALYNRYFSSPIIDKALASSSHRDLDWNSYMFHIINITNANRDLNALPGLLDVYKVIDLANIDRLKSTKQSLTIALQIFQLVEANIPAVIERDETAGDNGDSSNDGDNGNTESTGGESSTPEGESKDDGSKADGDEAITGTAQGSGAGGLGGEDLPDLTTRQQAQLQKAIQKQKDFINNNIKKTKLNKTEQKKMQALDESGSEIKKVGRTTNRYTGNVYETECILVKKLTKNVIDNAGYSFLQGQYWKSKGVVLTDAVNKGVTLGRQLGKKLKLRSEERNTKFTRLDTGKIDKRLISSLGYGAERVFQQVMNDKFTPVNVHISIDASGSMHGSRFENCQTAVVAIAKAASMIDNMDIQVSYRTTTGDKPIILIAYDSRVDSFRKVTTLFKHICASNLTPEGLTFEAIKNELVTASGDKESYFINFSDGMPYCEPKGYSYYGASAVSHTRKQVDNMKLRGIKVLSYFIGNKDFNTSDDLPYILIKSSRTIDVTSLIPLAKTLNKMFLTK